MPVKQGYEVIRFVQQGGEYHVVSDYVTGQTFYQCLKNRAETEKAEVFLWLQELAKQLEQLHHLQGKPCYQFVTPYSILVTEENHIALLDLKAEANRSIMKELQKRTIRQQFLKENAEGTYKRTAEMDLYGYAKTMQFTFAHSNLKQDMTVKEEHQFQKIIKKCLSNKQVGSYSQFKEVLKDFPKIKIKTKTKPKKEKRWIMAAICVCTFLMAGIACYLHLNAKEAPRVKQPEKKKAMSEKEVVAYKELGMTYFIDMQDYQKSRSYFSVLSDDDEFSKCYEVMSIYLLGEDAGERAIDAAKKAETLAQNKADIRYYLGPMRIYARQGTSEAWGELIKLGEYTSHLGGWQQADKDNAIKLELGEYLAKAYEATGKMEEAIKRYEEMCTLTKEMEKLEQLYIRLVELYAESGQQEKALQTCQQALNQIGDSERLKLLYIKTQCGQREVPRESCAETIALYLKETPELAETEAFQKLQREYEITVEGENVWVGK